MDADVSAAAAGAADCPDSRRSMLWRGHSCRRGAHGEYALWGCHMGVPSGRGLDARPRPGVGGREVSEERAVAVRLAG
jgi:hypothetical protein